MSIMDGSKFKILPSYKYSPSRVSVETVAAEVQWWWGLGEFFYGTPQGQLLKAPLRAQDVRLVGGGRLYPARSLTTSAERFGLYDGTVCHRLRTPTRLVAESDGHSRGEE
jgi:hypothetical protein